MTPAVPSNPRPGARRGRRGPVPRDGRSAGAAGAPGHSGVAAGAPGYSGVAAGSPGYSGRSLADKLGLRPGVPYLVIDAPPDFAAWLGPLPDGASLAAGTADSWSRPAAAPDGGARPSARPSARRVERSSPRARTRAAAAAAPQAVHVFVLRAAELASLLARLRRAIDPTGFVWVSWPKKASGVATDVTEDVIRRAALPLGLVDVKVCAVSDVWSGLKLVVRRELR